MTWSEKRASSRYSMREADPTFEFSEQQALKLQEKDKRLILGGGFWNIYEWLASVAGFPDEAKRGKDKWSISAAPAAKSNLAFQHRRRLRLSGDVELSRPVEIAGQGIRPGCSVRVRCAWRDLGGTSCGAIAASNSGDHRLSPAPERSAEGNGKADFREMPFAGNL